MKIDLSHLNLIEKFIVEHGSATVMGVHINFLRDQLAAFERERTNLKAEVTHLRTENATLTAQLAEAQQRAIRVEACVADVEDRIKQAEAEKDILRKQFEPPDLQISEIKIIRLLAVRGHGISRGGLRTQALLDRTRGDYHINRLEQTFNFIHERSFADGRVPLFELTDKGKMYAVKNDMDKTQPDAPANDSQIGLIPKPPND